MREGSSQVPDMTIGLDVSDRYTQACVLDAEGQVRERLRLRTTSEALAAWLADRPRCRMVLETGTHATWMAHRIEACGHEVLVANARRIPTITRSDRKSDRVDAEQLARLGRFDPRLLQPVTVRRAQTLPHLALVRTRDTLVRQRVGLLQHLRGTAKASGVQLPRTTSGRKAQAWLGQLPESLRGAAAPVLATLLALEQQIRELDRQVHRLCTEVYPETSVLQQVFGVGEKTALTYVLVVQDPWRRSSRAAGAFVGLVPRRDQSGQRDPELHITKAGDPLLRRLLVQCAHVILGARGPDTDLRRWGLALASRGGKKAKRRAVIAVARRLAVLLHALWRSGEVYEPLRHATSPTSAT